jgi:hypothetical protein
MKHLTLTLSQKCWGRILLHVICIIHAPKAKRGFYVAGIRRELHV